jgi:L-lactate permease
MCSILTTVQYIPRYNIIFNTYNIHYLTNCTETATNDTNVITYQRRRELQKWTPYILINVQLNVTDIAAGNGMLALRKSHLYFIYRIVWQYIFAATVSATNAHYIQCLKYVFMKLAIYCLRCSKARC